MEVLLTKLRPFLVILIALFVLRIAYIALASSLQPQESISIHSVTKIFKKNDSWWYQKIANNGYPEIRERKEIGFSQGSEFKQSAWAFFPAYPMILRATRKTFKCSMDVAMMVHSMLFSVLCFVGLFQFLRTFYENNHERALFTVLLLMLFPFHFYFSVYYTEAPFLALLIWSFVCVQRQWYLGLTVLLIPLVLIRPNGILMVVPLYLFYLERQGLISRFQIKWSEVFAWKSLKGILYFLSAPLAFAAYCYYQYSLTGFFNAFSIAQDGWYREFMFPLLSLFRTGSFAGQFNSWFSIGVILYAVISWKRLPLSLSVFVWLGIIIPLCSGSVTSMPRFISVIFPLFMALSAVFFQSKWRWLMLAPLAALHFLTFWLWLVNNPLSY